MTNQQAPEALAFCWATELAMTQQPVTLSVTEAREVSADMQRLHTENTTLQQGYAAARLEIESLQARIKTMAEEHADELMVAHLDGMRAAQPAGAQQPGDCGNTPYDEGPFTLAQQPGAAYAELPSYEHQRAIMEAERRASLDAFDPDASLTRTEERLYETAFTNGWDRAMRAAQPVGAQQPGDCGNTPYDEGPFTLAQQPGAAYAEPQFPAHPESMVMDWSALEIRVIAQYGRDMYEAGKCASHGQAPAQAAPVCGSPADLPPLPDPDLRDVGTTPGGIKEFLRGYATEYAKAALAARATADSLTAPAGEGVAGPDGKCMGPRCIASAENGYVHSRECIDEAGEVQGWKPTAEDYATCGPSAPTQPVQAADSVLEGAARYRYLRDVPMDEWPDELAIAFRLQQNAILDAAIDAARKEKQMNTEIDDSIVLDAARYGWLRHGDNDEKVLKTYTSRPSKPGEPTMFLPRNDELDRLIDAARKQGANHD